MCKLKIKLQAFLSVALIFVCAVANACAADEVNILVSAQRLGHTLQTNGYVYPRGGLPPNSKTIDCTEFVLKLLVGITNLPAAARTRITMRDLSESVLTNNNYAVVREGDSRTKGVQQALIDLHRGEAVALTNAKSGDLIQYWMRQSNGEWFGHAGVIERVEGQGANRRVWLYGAHKSVGGIGTAPAEGLRLITADDRRIYLVRFK